MSVTWRTTKSCCGANSLSVETDKSIRKHQLQVFADAGYSTPQIYIDAGMFYVSKNGLVATAPFGATKFVVKCSGGCDQQKNEFAQTLERAINTQK